MQTCAELKLHTTELKEDLTAARSQSAKSMTNMQEHQQRELRTLVASAQQDLDAARLANQRAERERMRAVDQARPFFSTICPALLLEGYLSRPIKSCTVLVCMSDKRAERERMRANDQARPFRVDDSPFA